MLIKSSFSRLVLGAALVTGGIVLPAMAQAHDRPDGDWEYWHHQHHRHHWHDRYEREYPPQVRIYERRYIEPNVYYGTSYGYPDPRDGLTIIYRDR